jgi:hypothetical protein
MKKFFILFVLIFTNSAFTQPLILEGHSPLEFKAKALMEVYFIDVYDISHYKSEAAEAIKLDYIINVSSKHSCEGWEKGLKQNLSEQEMTPQVTAGIKWLCEVAVDVKKGDNLVFYREKNLLKIYHNQKLLQEKNDEVIAPLLLMPWLGPKPVAPALLKKS